MTATPFHDIQQRARAAALKGTRLHLEIDHARAMMCHPEFQAMLGRLIAEETAKLCLAAPTPDSPPLPLFQDLGHPPDPSPMRPALPPPGSTGSASTAKSSGSNGAPNGSGMPSPGTIAPLVSAAASSQVLDQAQQLIHQGRLSKRSQRITPPAPGRPSPRRPPRLALAQS